MLARGNDGNQGSGGGSGGSIWIYCDTIKGFGRFSVDGGDGYDESSSYQGAGGGAGRFAMYFRTNNTSPDFNYHAIGGKAGDSQAENGGAGTVFIFDLGTEHRTLILDNGGLQPRTTLHTLWDYSDIADDGCRTWVLPQSGLHFFANGTNNYHFEELQMYGDAHAAVLTNPVDTSATLFFLYMIGDRTGTFHVGFNQTLDLERSQIDLPFNARVYEGGYLGLAPDTIVHDVTIWMHGILDHVQNLLLRHNGYFYMEQGGHTEGQLDNAYEFSTILVKDYSVINGALEPTLAPQINISVDSLYIEGGGVVSLTYGFIQATNLTIDDGGHLSGDGLGYSSEDNHDLINGINIGQGVLSSAGSSGGGHGGTSGRGEGEALTGQPYGNLYEPFDFGSSGGGSEGGSGGGFLLFNITGILKVDGVISTNGGSAGNDYSGGGSGGSILINCNTIKGRGYITAKGGSVSGSNIRGGGGAGGRIAVYLMRNDTFRGKFETHGGEGFEPGGPGTSFFYHLKYNHRTLLLDNAFLESAYVNTIDSYADISSDSFKAWVLPNSGEHHFAGGNHDYHFDELQIYGNAHFAILTEPHDRNASLYFLHMIGDRSGVIHIGPNQVMNLERDYLDTPFSSYVYQDGYLGLGVDTVLSYVFIHNEGTIDHIHNLTLYNGALVDAFLTSSTNSLPSREYRFNGTVTIKARSLFNFNAPHAHNESYHLMAKNLLVEGGGTVLGKYLDIESENMVVDDGGNVNVSDGGFQSDHGIGEFEINT